MGAGSLAPPSSLFPGAKARLKISLAHSPDSDDAFMFYGLARGKVESGEFDVTHVLTDIETLNQEAKVGKHEVTAISFHAYPFVADKYALMPCGGSIGDVTLPPSFSMISLAVFMPWAIWLYSWSVHFQ